MRRLLLLLSLSACNAPLPGLLTIEQADDLPRRLVFLESETPIQPGSWVDVDLEVRGGSLGDDRLLSGERITFSLPNLRQSRGKALELAQGSSCASDSEGRCRLALLLGTERGDWILAAQADRNPEAQAQTTLSVPLGQQRKLRLSGAGLGESVWRAGDPSPWQDQAIRLGQSAAEGETLSFEVFDEHDNPLVGAEGVTVASLSVDGDGNCQGPCFVDSQARLELLPDAEGRAQLQLFPGPQIGRFQLVLSLSDAQARSQQLNLEVVVAGRQPASVGLPEGASASCARGDALRQAPALEPTLQLQVRDLDGLPVQGVELKLASDAVSLNERTVATDAAGRAVFSGTCPSSVAHLASGRPRVFVEVTDHPDLNLELPVDWEGAAPSSLDYRPTNAGETELVAGEVVSLRFQVRDHLGGPVAGALVRASARHPADSSRLTLAQEQGGYGAERTLTSDGDGFVNFQLRAVGARTLAGLPLELAVSALSGSEPQVLLPIDVLAGSPQRVTVVQGEGLHLMVGEGGGVLAFRVDDGEGSGNPIPGVEVQLTVPDGLVVGPSQGFTGNDGVFFAQVLQVLSEGEHELIATARWTAADQQVWTESTRVTVTGGQGQATRISAYRNGQRLEADEAVVATVGEPLAQALSLRVENERFGAIPSQALGFLLEPGQEGGVDGCGNGPAVAGGLETDAETGSLLLGGVEGIEWLLGTRARTCRWRISSGNAESILVLQQQAGPPQGGRFDALPDGTTLTMHGRRPAVLDGGDGGTVQVAIAIADRFANPVTARSIILVPANCYVQSGILRPNEAGRISTLVTGGSSVDQECVLRLTTEDGWLEPIPELRIPVTSEPSRFGRWVFAGDRRYLVHDPEAPAEGESVLDLYEPDERVVFPDGELDEDLRCANPVACAQLELLFLGDPLQASPPLLLKEAPQDGLIIQRVDANHYRVSVPRSLFHQAGRYGFRLRNPDGVRGSIEPFFVLHRPTFLKDDVQVSPVAGTETVQAFDAFLDGQTVLTCGRDEVGSWVASAPLAPVSEGFNPLPETIQAIRVSEGQWVKMGYTAGRFEPNREPRLHQPGWGLCIRTDLDGDGDQDLVVAGPDGGNQAHRPCLEMVFSDGAGGFEDQTLALEGYCDGTAACTLRQQAGLAILAYCPPEFPEGGGFAALSEGVFDRDGNRAIELSMGGWERIEMRRHLILPTDRLRVIRAGSLGQGGLFQAPAVIDREDRGTDFRLSGARSQELTGSAPAEMILNPYYLSPVAGAEFAYRQPSHLTVGRPAPLPGNYTGTSTGRNRMAPGGRYLLNYASSHIFNVRIFDLERFEPILLLPGINFGQTEQARAERSMPAMNAAATEVVVGNSSVQKLSLPDLRPLWTWTADEGGGCRVGDLVWDGVGPVLVQTKNSGHRNECGDSNGLWWLDPEDGSPIHHEGLAYVQAEGELRLFWSGRYPFVVSADYSRILINYRQAETIDGIGGRLARVAQVHAQEPWLSEVIPRWMTWGGYGSGNYHSMPAGVSVLSPDGRFLVGMGNSAMDDAAAVELVVWRYDFEAPEGQAPLLTWPWRPDWIEGERVDGRSMLYTKHLPVFRSDDVVSLTTANAGGFNINRGHEWPRQRWVRQNFALSDGQAVGWPEYWHGSHAGSAVHGYRADLSVPDANGDANQALRIAQFGNMGHRFYRAQTDGRQTDMSYRELLPGTVVDALDLSGDDQDELLLIDTDTLRIWQGKRPAEHCGNGRLEQGERCDDGPGRDDGDCPMDCRSVCGDGQRSSLEACDDGNDEDGDGCSAVCEVED